MIQKSVMVRRDQKKWLGNNELNFSQLCRNALDREIERRERIKKLKKLTKEDLKDNIATYEVEEEKVIEERERKLNEVIINEILEKGETPKKTKEEVRAKA